MDNDIAALYFLLIASASASMVYWTVKTEPSNIVHFQSWWNADVLYHRMHWSSYATSAEIIICLWWSVVCVHKCYSCGAVKLAKEWGANIDYGKREVEIVAQMIFLGDLGACSHRPPKFHILETLKVYLDTFTMWLKYQPWRSKLQNEEVVKE